MQFDIDDSVPSIYEVAKTSSFYGHKIILEIIEHKEDNICRCIALAPTYGLQRNSKVLSQGEVLRIPKGEKLLGRIVNVLGDPIDDAGPIEVDDCDRIVY